MLSFDEVIERMQNRAAELRWQAEAMEEEARCSALTAEERREIGTLRRKAADIERRAYWADRA